MIEILNKIYFSIYKFISFFKKRSQKLFYDYEKYNEIIYINKLKYFNFHGQFFSEKKLIKNSNFSKKLKKKYKNVIIIINKKSSDFFHYFLDKKSFKRYALKNSLNFFKINLEGKKEFKFKIHKSDLVLKPIFSELKSKRKLVLILIVDGLGNDLTYLMSNTNNFFGLNNKFTNAWSNAEWTLPSVGNLLSGMYTSNHQCWNNQSSYTSRFNLQNKLENQVNLNEVNTTMFESFKKLGFITGFYSPYIRMNPTYGHDRGVDIFKYCKENSVDEILDCINSQIDLFNNHSNFIIAHIFDSKGPTKKYLRLAEQSLSNDENYNYQSKNELQNLNLKNLSIRDESQSLLSENLFRYIDNRLGLFFKTLNTKNYDDYSIFLFGDHGTRREKQNKTNKVLSSMQNNIGFYVKDNKFNFNTKKDNIMQMIDIFPSLSCRYSNHKSNKKIKFDGKNVLYSANKSEFSIAESIWGNHYSFFIKIKNYFTLITHNFDNLKKIKEINFYDLKENKVDDKKIPKKIFKKVHSIFKNFKKTKNFFKN
tara:strand:+ start:284 stop:1888 length:1605 start_codon:yes stop_codon:yes gene_type:complete